MKRSETVRDRGYEALFVLAHVAMASLRPTLRNAMEMDHELGAWRLRREEIRRLGRKNLVEVGERGGREILRLTGTGRRVLAGGRDPEAAWSREWDGMWRILLFDIPQKERRARTHFWRWLKANHFGRFQGSAWATPDPVPDIETTARGAGLDPSMFMAVTGELSAARRPRELAANAWDFASINESYNEYLTFAERVGRQLRAGSRGEARIKGILVQDRRLWWSAVESDPLLPSVLLPRGYRGKRAWQSRQKLHRLLARTIGANQ